MDQETEEQLPRELVAPCRPRLCIATSHGEMMLDYMNDASNNADSPGGTITRD